MDIKEVYLKHKKLSIILGIFVYFALFSGMPKIIGFLTMIASGTLIIYLFKGNKFKETGKLKKAFITIGLLFIFLIGVSGLSYDSNDTEQQRLASEKSKQEQQINKSSNNQSIKSNPASEQNTQQTNVNGQLKVHYINVGQGDSILIQQGNSNMLIDTGTNASTSSLISYLQKQNIKKLDYLVLTHPHEDHIGGADAVIKGFDIGTIYMPKITTTTKTFEDVVNAMNSKGLKATSPNLGDTFKLGDANCSILGPINSNKEDLNTYSIVIKLTFGNNKFLFTGDAQASNEQDMLSKGLDLSADVLKVGHHGSHTSTSQVFLNNVKPKYAIISVGKGNDYGHPYQGTMDRLKGAGVEVYRTDENGTILCTSDGNNIKFNTQPGSYAGNSSSSSSSTNIGNTSSKNVVTPPPVKTTPVPSNSGQQYVDANGNGLIKGNASSKIYHLPGGAYYNRTKAEVWFKTEAEAQAAGYRRSKR